MVRAILGAALVLSLAGTAWAQSDEDYAKYTRPVIDKFTACERPKIVKWASRTQEGPDALADRAIEECREYLDELHHVMEAAPFNLSESEATEAIEQMLQGLRPLMVDDIVKVRKG